MAAPPMSQDQDHKEPASEPLMKGSCLCGLTTFTVTGAPLTTLLCHCSSCKKASGSSFQANACYDPAQLSLTSLTSPLATTSQDASQNVWLKEETKITTYCDRSADSGATVERSFCARCGSRLWNRNPAFPEVVAVAVGALDFGNGEGEGEGEGWKGWRPEREYFCKGKAEWLCGVGAEESAKRFWEMG